jgi:hypothetical protein
MGSKYSYPRKSRKVKIMAEQLERITKLYESGMITQSEFVEETLMLVYINRAKKLAE